MGYRCPVCADPQPDGEHLANHLAFTAMLGDGDHEEWLDEQVPSWGEEDPASLGTILAEELEAVELEGGGDTSERHQGRPDVDAPPNRDPMEEPGDPETRAIIEEAREMTREMYEDDGEPADTEGEDG
jgi:hypothetical protein